MSSGVRAMHHSRHGSRPVVVSAGRGHGVNRAPGTTACADRAMGTDVAAMLTPPLYQYAYDEGLGTVYTAHYRPSEGRVTYHWPGESWEQSFAGFAPGSRAVLLGREV